MRSCLFTVLSVAALAFGSLGAAGAAQSTPAAPVPLAPGDDMVPGDSMDGADAVMMIQRMMWECMYGGAPGIPRAVKQDRGVQFVCM